MSDKKQTATEWLREKLWIEFKFSFSDNIMKQAKEIEKNQIIEAHGDKLKKSKDSGNYEYWFTGKDYYNKNFKNTENETI